VKGFGAVAKAFVVTCFVIALTILVWSAQGLSNIAELLPHLPFLFLIVTLPTFIFALPGFGIMRSTLYLLNCDSALSFAIGGALAGPITLLLLQIGPMSGVYEMSRELATTSGTAAGQPTDWAGALQFARGTAAFMAFGAVMGLVYYRLERRFSGGVTFINRGQIRPEPDPPSRPSVVKFSKAPVLWSFGVSVGYCLANAATDFAQMASVLADIGRDMRSADWFAIVVRPYFYYSLPFNLPGFVVALASFSYLGHSNLVSRIGIGIAARAGALTLVQGFTAITSGAFPQLLWHGAVFGLVFWFAERAIAALFRKPKSSEIVDAATV
jgi:hypothetical protein